MFARQIRPLGGRGARTADHHRQHRRCKDRSTMDELAMSRTAKSIPKRRPPRRNIAEFMTPSPTRTQGKRKLERGEPLLRTKAMFQYMRSN